jgi:hypothetical protein
MFNHLPNFPTGGRITSKENITTTTQQEYIPFLSHIRTLNGHDDSACFLFTINHLSYSHNIHNIQYPCLTVASCQRQAPWTVPTIEKLN